MQSQSHLIAENISLKQELQNVKLELSQWKQNYDDLSLKYHRLSEKKILVQEIDEMEDIRLQNQQLLEKEFKLSVSLQELQHQNTELKQQNRELIDQIDFQQQKTKKYDHLQQQYLTLQQASQQQYQELDNLRNKPPQIIVPNPDVTNLYKEVNRLQKIIIDQCRNSFS